MALLNKTIISGAHLGFSRNGADDSGTPVSSSHKPAADSALYEDLGPCESLEIEQKIDELKLKAPVSGGGRYRMRETIPLSQEMSLKAKFQQWNQHFLEALFLGSAALAVGTAFQPLKQAAKITGWLQVIQYDQGDTERFRHYFYVEITVSKMSTGEKQYMVEPEFTVLDNTSGTVKVVSLS
jgi:hypothetical protein